MVDPVSGGGMSSQQGGSASQPSYLLILTKQVVNQDPGVFKNLGQAYSQLSQAMGELMKNPSDPTAQKNYGDAQKNLKHAQTRLQFDYAKANFKDTHIWQNFQPSSLEKGDADTLSDLKVVTSFMASEHSSCSPETKDAAQNVSDKIDGSLESGDFNELSDAVDQLKNTL